MTIKTYEEIREEFLAKSFDAEFLHGVPVRIPRQAKEKIATHFISQMKEREAGVVGGMSAKEYLTYLLLRTEGYDAVDRKKLKEDLLALTKEK